ncbi:MAG TPA: CDP-alcohol phosphatidyltransferase family protein [Planctomycetota bacterium]|jgi:CDP-diacylglycerol--serine O-phosphatidyltransferase
MKRDDKPRRLLKGIHPIPTLVTLGNLLSGLGSIMLAMRAAYPPRNLNFDADDCLYWAGMLIFAAMIFDVMDGKVARWTKSTSKFGMEMDSLADVISFGVAPAILVKAMIDQQLINGNPFPLMDRFLFPLLGTYTACAALRLARYNVEADTGHRDFFFGMPSPGAAGCVASLVIFILPGGHHSPLPQLQDASTAVLIHLRQSAYHPVMLAMPFLMMGWGVLMVTRVLYPHVGDRFLRGRKSFMHLIVLGLILVLAVVQTEIVLVLAFNGYMLLGLLNEVRYQFVPSHRPKEWLQFGEEPAPPPAPAGQSAPQTPLKEPPVA